LEFSARTRSKYEDRDAAATFGFGSINLRMASACAFNEGGVNNESNITAIVIAKHPGPRTSGGCGVTVTTLIWAIPCVCQVPMLNGESICINLILVASPHPTVLE
jgi:hypothetical protein